MSLLIVAADVSAAGWVHRYSAMPQARTEAIASRSDGGFVFVTSGMPGAVIAIDAAGQVRASRTLSVQMSAVATARSGDVLVAGSDSVAKLDSRMTPQWSRRLALADQAANVTSIDATSDGGAIVAGSSFFAKLNAKGGIEWSMALAGVETEIASIRQTSDGAYICAGANNKLPWLAKVSRNGELEWQRTYSAAAGSLRSAIESKDGGFLAVGNSDRLGLVIRIDTEGKRVWASMATRGFPGHAIAETPAGSIAAFRAGREIQLTAFTPDGSMRWHRIVSEPNEFPDESGSPAKMFAPAADGVVFSFPFKPRVPMQDGEPGPRLYKMNDAGETVCENVYAGVPMVSVPLSSNLGSALWTTVRMSAKRLALATTPISAAAIGETCHWTRAPEMKPDPIRVNGDRYRALLNAGNFDALETIGEELRRAPLGDPMRPHQGLERFYAALASETTSEDAMFASLRAWQSALPASITAQVALANAFYRAAWDRRGSDYDVTSLGRVEYLRMLDEAATVLKRLEGRGDVDPHYWVLRTAVAKERDGADVREIARRALSVHPNPEIAWRAAFFLFPRWGGSPEEVVAFAEEAARLTHATHGDIVYTWLAYQVAAKSLNQDDEDLADYKFDWERIRRGAREAIAKAPEFRWSYHRLASLAVIFKDLETARELFSRKELDWSEDVSTIWRGSSRYDEAREWALPKPAPKPFVPPVPALESAPRPQMPVLPEIPKTDTSRWPLMVLQTKLTTTLGDTHDRIAAFLVKTESGIVAVSAAPVWPNRMDRDNVLERLLAQFKSWTIASPERPKRTIPVTSLLTTNAPNYQLGVALAAKIAASKPPVKPLTIRRFSQSGELSGALFIIGCTWDGGRCKQTIFEGRYAGMHTTKLHALRTIDIGLTEVVEPERFHGAAVLDGNGNVIAVATGRQQGWSPLYKTLVSADVLDTVVP